MKKSNIKKAKWAHMHCFYILCWLNDLDDEEHENGLTREEYRAELIKEIKKLPHWGRKYIKDAMTAAIDELAKVKPNDLFIYGLITRRIYELIGIYWTFVKEVCDPEPKKKKNA